MTDSWQQQLDALEGAYSRESLAAARIGDVSGNARVRDLLRDHAQRVSEVGTSLRGAGVEIHRLRSDTMLYPMGREQAVAKWATDGREAAAKAEQIAQSLALVAKAELEHQALPRLRDPERERPAREEFRMLMDGQNDPASVLAELAQRDDDLAAIAASSFAESYLRARGLRPEDAKAHSAAARQAAVSVAVNSSDPKVRAAGEALALVPSLDGKLACARALAQFDLDAALAEPPAVE